MFFESLKRLFDLNGVTRLFSYTLNVLLDFCNHFCFFFDVGIKHSIVAVLGAVAKGLNV